MVDHALKRCYGVFNAEGHHFVAINAPICDDGCLVFVWGIHHDLVVAGVRIHNAQQLISDCDINHLVNTREWEVVFGTSFV